MNILQDLNDYADTLWQPNPEAMEALTKLLEEADDECN